MLGLIAASLVLPQKRKLTLGPLLQACIQQRIIRPEWQTRFETFKLERHWLVHRSLVENGDDLYRTTTRDAVFTRILGVQQEAFALKKLVFADLESWYAAQGGDLQKVQQQAEEAIRELKGTDPARR